MDLQDPDFAHPEPLHRRAFVALPQASRTRLLGLILGASTLGLGVLAAGASAGGGVGGIPDPPRVSDATCVSQCVGLREATMGSKVQLRGKNLSGVDKVSFKSQQGRVKAEPTSVSGKVVKVNVPKKAISGKPRAVDGETTASSPVKIKIRPQSALPKDGEFKLTSTEVSNKVGYYNGKRKPKLSFIFSSNEPVDVRIDIVKRGTAGKVIRSYVRQGLQPHSPQTLQWNGARANGKPAPSGNYVFKIGQDNFTTEAGKNGSTTFKMFQFKFPLPSRHQYGDGLGAGRGHMGQDVFAKCGKPIVAARGGKVQVSTYQSRAGYYVVIDGKRTGKDHFYAHMQRRGRVKRGQTVKTGERIGYNSDTGSASGCHLHFEIWSSPGWYEGGRATNPTPPLRQWDKWS